MPELIRNIVYDFSVEVKEVLGNTLSSIILYGSYAKGDYCENSDIDIMILTGLLDKED